MQKSGQKQSDQEQRQVTTSNIIIADACATPRLFLFFFSLFLYHLVHLRSEFKRRKQEQRAGTLIARRKNSLKLGRIFDVVGQDSNKSRQVIRNISPLYDSFALKLRKPVAASIYGEFFTLCSILPCDSISLSLSLSAYHHWHFDWKQYNERTIKVLCAKTIINQNFPYIDNKAWSCEA